MSGPLAVLSDSCWDDELDSPQQAAAAAAHTTDDWSDNDDDAGSISGDHAAVAPSPSSSRSAYKHLRVRYTALRTAYRRQEGELEAVRAAHSQSQAEARAASEDRKKEQRAVQQLMSQLAQLQEANTELRAREERWSAREQQLMAEQRAADLQLSQCKEECGRLQCELDQQYGAVTAERRRLVATVSRHLSDESAQQRTVHSLTQAVDDMRAEAASREAEREQLLSDMQLMRDAVQILQAQLQQAGAESEAEKKAGGYTLDATREAAAALTGRLFLSPLHLHSPAIDSTPSTSTCAALHFSSPPLPRPVAPPVRRPTATQSSPLAEQLLHAHALSSPQPANSTVGCGEEFGSHTELLTSAPELLSSSSPLRSSPAAAVPASSVSPLSPFSVDEFPPLPSSPSTVLPTPRSSVWNSAAKRSRSGVSLSAPPPAAVANIARSLHFSTGDDDSAPAASAKPTAAEESSHSCSSACSHCQHAAPPASIIAPLAFDTPVADRSAGRDPRDASLATPVTAALRLLPSSTPCSSCQLRTSSALLTPQSSSQRSLAVLDSEFRRVKRWTAQLQQQITKQQQRQREESKQEQQQPGLAKQALSSPRIAPASAALPSPHSRRPTVASRWRSNSEPHYYYAPSAERITPSPAPTDRTLAAAVGDSSSRSPPPQQQPHSSSSLPVATLSPAPVSVSVSSLLVQLSLCESELSLKNSSLQAATQHISALHDKLSVMADSIEQLEHSMDAHSQQWQQQRSEAADERERERRAASDELQAAERRVAELAERCAALQLRLDEASLEAVTQQGRYLQQSADWERRCAELLSAVAELQAAATAQAELNSSLRAELETATTALQQQHKPNDTAQAEQQLLGEDERGSVEETVADVERSSADPAPLLQLVEQQLTDELIELHQLLNQFEP